MIRKTTKELLAESFRELAEQKPINKITIANITDNCGMTQPTFYRYYKDKYDLIAWIYVTDSEKIMGQIGSNG
ncbi:MAG: TetR family transcriptional regulator, partial [Oscillospiraceae bacterium]|nr:TetR family transcriptional regulator [Oscillospiraceae bacterium]